MQLWRHGKVHRNNQMTSPFLFKSCIFFLLFCLKRMWRVTVADVGPFREFYIWSLFRTKLVFSLEKDAFIYFFFHVVIPWTRRKNSLNEWSFKVSGARLKGRDRLRLSRARLFTRKLKLSQDTIHFAFRDPYEFNMSGECTWSAAPDLLLIKATAR